MVIKIVKIFKHNHRFFLKKIFQKNYNLHEFTSMLVTFYDAFKMSTFKFCLVKVEFRILKNT